MKIEQFMEEASKIRTIEEKMNDIVCTLKELDSGLRYKIWGADNEFICRVLGSNLEVALEQEFRILYENYKSRLKKLKEAGISVDDVFDKNNKNYEVFSHLI